MVVMQSRAHKWVGGLQVVPEGGTTGEIDGFCRFQEKEKTSHRCSRSCFCGFEVLLHETKTLERHSLSCFT